MIGITQNKIDHLTERIAMKVYLLKDIEKIGMAGEILKVKQGYASNFLIPKKLAVLITAGNEAFYRAK